MMHEAVPKLRPQNSLKDQVTELLRNQLISGKVAPATKLVEREVAEWLGVSRAPVREALLELEKEGLIESRTNGRYVIELSIKDVEDLYRVRLALETLAVDLATRNMNESNAAELSEALSKMQTAAAENDRDGFHQGDIELHRLIWKQADNPHLEKVIHSILGPIFIFIANPVKRYNLMDTHRYHEELVEGMSKGDVELARQSIARHMKDSLKKRLTQFDDDPGYGGFSSPDNERGSV